MTTIANDGASAVPLAGFNDDAGALNFITLACSASPRRANIKIPFVDKPGESS